MLRRLTRSRRKDADVAAAAPEVGAAPDAAAPSNGLVAPRRAPTMDLQGVAEGIELGQWVDLPSGGRVRAHVEPASCTAHVATPDGAWHRIDGVIDLGIGTWWVCANAADGSAPAARLRLWIEHAEVGGAAADVRAA